MARIRGWPGGINTVAEETGLARDELRDAVNVDLTLEGKPRSRRGGVRRFSGTHTHSLSNRADKVLFVDNGELKALNPDYSATSIRSGLSPFLPVEYAEVNGQVYYANGSQSGIVEPDGSHSDWGVADPGGQPAAENASPGGLQAGKYQVSVTHVDVAGRESGATLATTAEVTSGALLLSLIPQHSPLSTRIYVSEPNGSVLRHAVDIPAGVTEYRITSPAGGRVLETQFKRRFPEGSIVRYFGGRMWAVVGSALVYSDALNYGLYSPLANYFQFAEEPTVMEPVLGGIFIVADKTYFLSGTDPSTMRQTKVSDEKAVAGTGTALPASAFDLERVDTDVAFWYADSGATVGLPDGTVILPMEGKVRLPPFERGASFLRSDDGVKKVVTALRGPGDASSFSVGDQVATEIVRNGITL